MSVKVHLADFYPLIRETLDQGGTFTMTITGSSMFPFILGGRDQVTLSPITEDLKKNDLPFYLRSNGQFVLHRIVKVEKDGTYTCCGDHQWALERGLKREQMIGICTQYVRKGRTITNKNILYRMYRTFWTWILNYRWIIFKLYGKWSAVRNKRRKIRKEEKGN